MKRCKISGRNTAIAAIAAAIVVMTGSVFAQSVDDVLRADQQRINLAQASQERINTVVQRTRSLEDQYRSVNKEIDGLRVYNRLMTAQTNGQKATLEDIALSMDQVDVINRQIFPLMERMIDGLEQSIALDIPFLKAERVKRVDTLKEIMERSDVSVAEKSARSWRLIRSKMTTGRPASGIWRNSTSTDRCVSTRCCALAGSGCISSLTIRA